MVHSMRNADQINSPAEVLSQCIQAIEANEATIESCVARFPDVPELEKLLRAMTTAQRLPRPALAPADKSAMRQALLNRYRERQSSKQVPQAARPRRGMSWLRVAAALSIVVVILFMSSAGLVRASSDAVPGDGLYGLKRLVEQVELSNADVRTRPETLYRIALTRIAEVNVLAERRLTLTEGELNDLSQSVKVALVLQADKIKRIALVNTADTALTKAESVGVLTAMRRAEVMQTLSTVPDSAITTQATPGSDSTMVTAPMHSSATSVPTLTAVLTLTPTATGTLTPTPSETGTPSLTPTGTETPTETPDSTETLTTTPEESPSVDATSGPLVASTPTDKAHPTRKPTKSNPGQGTPNGGQGNGDGNGGGNSGGNSGNGKGGGSGGGNSNGKK
jgi:uncharacterized membrane protein YgcG